MTRSVRIPPIDWGSVDGVRVVVPVKVDWPELQLTEDQVMANAVASVSGADLPYPDRSIFAVEIDRPVDYADLSWWRHFRTKLTKDSHMPRVGSPLLGRRWRVRELGPTDA